MKPVRYDAEAESELVAKAGWYNDQRHGLGLDFLDEVKETRQRLREHPTRYALAPGVPPELSVHRIPLRRFPYALVYVELTG
jgi:hypothetical protein